MGDKVYIIAELSANHGNDLSIVLKTIEAAKNSGADAIKLQTFTPDSMTLDLDGPDFEANPTGPWAGRRLYSVYEEAALPYEWYDQIFDYAKKVNIDCFSAPFDKEAVDLLEKYNPPAYKIASFEITDIPLIRYTASKMKPIIISTGIATFEDIELAIASCREVGNNQITILKCTSSYPTLPEDADLLTISDIAEKFDVIPGLSDHTLGIEAPIIATALGAQVIEKHFILDKTIGGPDAHFSLDELEFSEMVKSVRIAEKMLGRVSYNMSESKKISREKARSLYICKDIKAGDKVTAENVRSIRPGYGLHPKYWEEVYGRKFALGLKKGTPLDLQQLE